MTSCKASHPPGWSARQWVPTWMQKCVSRHLCLVLCFLFFPLNLWEVNYFENKINVIILEAVSAPTTRIHFSCIFIGSILWGVFRVGMYLMCEMNTIVSNLSTVNWLFFFSSSKKDIQYKKKLPHMLC